MVAWFLGPAVLLRLLPAESPLRGKIQNITSVFSKHPRVLVPITLISICFHLLQISLHALMAYGLGADFPWSYLLVVIPMVNIVSTLPISWNGLGVRENAYVFLLTPGILSPEQALGFGAIWILSVTIASSIGGIVSVLTDRFEPVAAPQNSTSL
ncbi:MAG: hypothetical protein DCC75_05125 [Proteobacteria bacterium]|nr:MAG: hypothetical protein DCC75_05125 [Pseudomonadota bacterium]